MVKIRIHGMSQAWHSPFLSLYKTIVVALWATAPFYLIPGPFDLQFTKALGGYGLYLMGFTMITSAAGVWGQK